ncbi:MAG: phage replisome organizer N-terminal domain-containing protein [Lachnospiraceae bacterium]|nr:phage replisome organizer N-terminal domain-containing protein [Lachnospiraceae bacterium]
MAKRYYWLKLPDDFFRQKAIKKLRKIAGGDTYTVIYLKMLLVAMKQDGKIYFDGVENTFYEELALELDEEPEHVEVTVMFLLQQGLMRLVDDSEYVLEECDKMTGSESASAERMRRLRDKKASLCDIGVTEALRLGDGEKEIEIEKEKEIDKTICPELNSGPQHGEEREPGLTAEEKNMREPGRKAKGTETAALPGTKVEIDPSQVPDLMVETEPDQEVFIRLPLINHTEFAVTEDYVKELQELYPAADVKQELRKMRGWLDSNPKNRKTPRGIKRFITGWLAREQDRAPRKTGETQNGAPKSKNQFVNFTQRQYDYDKLERKMFGGTKE